MDAKPIPYVITAEGDAALDRGDIEPVSAVNARGASMPTGARWSANWVLTDKAEALYASEQPGAA